MLGTNNSILSPSKGVITDNPRLILLFRSVGIILVLFDVSTSGRHPRAVYIPPDTEIHLHIM